MVFREKVRPEESPESFSLVKNVITKAVFCAIGREGGLSTEKWMK